MAKKGQYLDRAGQRYGRLVALSYAGSSKSRSRSSLWMCRCDCGTNVVVSANGLQTGATASCGCLWRDVHAKLHRKHGKTGSPEHRAWVAMRTRCTNPRVREYHRYGGRGIKVCDRWQSFENFLADMGRRPSPKHSVDRIDNNGNYEPGNCRWATRSEQMRNTSVSLHLTIRGVRMPASQWSEIVGADHALVLQRLGAGWEHEAAVFAPSERRAFAMAASIVADEWFTMRNVREKAS